ncbi:MAG: hypothetical protein KatS3mg027_0681 [Bacteroidia bacterium]|nr:MAG: hypothetical protein KatS3mg027_0681 [Bacteroidia bacterium]
MKKATIILTAVSLLTLQSCYVYTTNVGKGPQGNTIIKKKNHYLIEGLVPLSTVDLNKEAGTCDFEVTVKFSFLDFLIAGITGGIYTPTTVIIRK